MNVEKNKLNITEDLIYKWGKSFIDANLELFLGLNQDYLILNDLNIRFFDKEIKGEDKKMNMEVLSKNFKETFPSISEKLFDDILNKKDYLIIRIYELRGMLTKETKQNFRVIWPMYKEVINKSKENLRLLNIVNYSTITKSISITLLEKSIENSAKELNINLLRMYEIAFIDALFEILFKKCNISKNHENYKKKNYFKYIRIFTESFKFYSILKYLENINDFETKEKIISFLNDNYLLDDGGFELLEFPYSIVLDLFGKNIREIFGIIFKLSNDSLIEPLYEICRYNYEIWEVRDAMKNDDIE